MAGEPIRRIAIIGWLCAIVAATAVSTRVDAAPPMDASSKAKHRTHVPHGPSSPPDSESSERFHDGAAGTSLALRQNAISRLPLQRLTPSAQQNILAVTDSPTMYRRLPVQAIDCDQDMFLFLTRKPEVMVGMWDLMGITNVQITRNGPYHVEARDGAGTRCQIDLVYGDPHLHIFVANGSYDGKLVAKPILGSGVFMVTSRYAKAADGRTTVTGTIDCFLKLDSLGADLIVRTLSGFIGRSADNNFAETARFVTQVSQASQRNPQAMLGVADRLPQVDEQTKQEFSNIIEQVATRASQRFARLKVKHQ